MHTDVYFIAQHDYERLLQVSVIEAVLETTEKNHFQW